MIMNTRFALVSLLVVIAGCNTSAEGPTYGSDAGPVLGDAHVTPGSDSGPVVAVDGGSGFHPPVCEGVADHVTRLRVRVPSPALLGPCAGTWSAFALLDGHAVGTPGADFDQLIPDAESDDEYDWNGYLQMGFQCTDGHWKTDYVAGRTATDMGVDVTAWYGTREVNMSHTRVYDDRLTVGMHESCPIL